MKSLYAYTFSIFELIESLKEGAPKSVETILNSNDSDDGFFILSLNPDSQEVSDKDSSIHVSTAIDVDINVNGLPFSSAEIKLNIVFNNVSWSDDGVPSAINPLGYYEYGLEFNHSGESIEFSGSDIDSRYYRSAFWGVEGLINPLDGNQISVEVFRHVLNRLKPSERRTFLDKVWHSVELAASGEETPYQGKDSKVYLFHELTDYNKDIAYETWCESDGAEECSKEYKVINYALEKIENIAELQFTERYCGEWEFNYKFSDETINKLKNIKNEQAALYAEKLSKKISSDKDLMDTKYGVAFKKDLLEILKNIDTSNCSALDVICFATDRLFASCTNAVQTARSHETFLEHFADKYTYSREGYICELDS